MAQCTLTALHTTLSRQNAPCLYQLAACEQHGKINVLQYAALFAYMLGQLRCADTKHIWHVILPQSRKNGIVVGNVLWQYWQ
jgi:hypothetical protein